MSNQDFKRKTIFIQKHYQLRSIMTLVLIIAASGLVSGLLLYFLLSSEISRDMMVAHQQLQNTWDSLLPSVLLANVVTVIVTGVVAGLTVLYQTHKVAGPLYRLQKICESVSAGDYNPVTRLRKEDQLTALAASFEEMLDNLRARKESGEQHKQQAIDLLTRLSDAGVDSQLIKELSTHIESTG